MKTQTHFREIPPEKLLKELQDSANYTIIDIRDKQSFEKEHIPHSLNIQPEQLLNNRELFTPYDQIYLICEDGNMSHAASLQLSNAEVKGVYNLTGGIDAWKKLGYPTSKQNE